jgi:SPP1 gp7 family putative phage head morphogenesis protein
MSRSRTRRARQRARGAGENASLAAIANAVVGNVARSQAAEVGLDPVLRIETTGTGASRKIAGLTPATLGTYLSDFYSGEFRDIAPIWHTMEHGDDLLAAVRADKRFGKIRKVLRSWQVTVPNADDLTRAEVRQAEAHAEFLRELYNNLRAESAVLPQVRGGIQQAGEFVCDALGKQFSFCAKVWTRSAGGSLRLTLKHVPLWYFSCAAGKFRFHPNYSSLAGDYIEEGQWLIGTRSRAIMEACSVLVLFKRLPLHQLVRILEKWGIPNVYGKTTAKPDSPEFESLKNAVAAYVADMVAVISGDGSLETLDQRFMSTNIHRPFLDLMNRLITINWTGGDLGTLAQSGTGTLAGGAQAEDTEDVIQADCDWVSDLFQEQIDRDAIALEFGPEVEPLAWFEARKSDRKDDKHDLAVLQAGVNLGAQIPRSYYHERFSVPEAASGDEILAVVNPYEALTGSAGGGEEEAGGGEEGAAESASAAVSAGASAVAARQRALAAQPGLALARHAAEHRRAHARRPSGIRQARRDLDRLYANAMPTVGRAYADMLRPMFDAMQGAAHVAMVDQIARNTPLDRTAFGEALAQTIFAAAMRGFRPIRREVPNRNRASAARASAAWRAVGGALKRAQRWLLRRPHQDDEDDGGMTPQPIEAAEQYWREQPLAMQWDEIGQLTWEGAQALGFRVADIASESALRQIWTDIDAALRGELTADEVIRTLTDRYGLGAAHAENVVRTTMQNAYQWAHYQQLTDPDVQREFPMWGFDVVLDDNTSEICEPLDGLAYPANDPIWDSLYPPNHYQCRTSVFPLGADEVEANGFRMGQGWPVNAENGAPVMPLQGFSGNVGRTGLGNLI